MACGVGVCMTCVMPVTGADGATRMVRSCVEGRSSAATGCAGTPSPTGCAGCPPTRSAHPGWVVTDGRSTCRVRARRRVTLPSPMMTASGCAAERSRAGPVLRHPRARGVRHQVGDGRPAVRAGHPADGRDAPRDAQLDRPPGPGHRRVRREGPGLAQAGGARTLVSIAGNTSGEFADVAATLRASDAFDAVVGVEVNISCPNVANRGLVFACDPMASAKVVAAGARAAAARHADLRQAHPRRHRHRQRRAGLREGRRRRAHHDQHAARHGHRHRPAAARSWPA